MSVHCKQTQKQRTQDEFPMSERSPESMAAAKKINRECSKIGKPLLMPASGLSTETTRYFATFVVYIELRGLFLQKYLETKMSRKTK